MPQAIMCIAPTEVQAENIVAALRADGFVMNNISVLLPDKSGTRDMGHEKHSKAPEGAATGAGAGALLGGTLGLLAGIGTLAVPGMGPFIAAGPIMGLLSGAGLGSSIGGLAGGLIGLGIPEFEAKQYETKLRNGNILLSVHVENGNQAKSAEEIMKKNGAHDIQRSAEEKVKTKS